MFQSTLSFQQPKFKFPAFLSSGAVTVLPSKENLQLPVVSLHRAGH